jgi:hypothetical protein
MAALIRAGILDGLHKDWGGSIVVSTNTERALTDFCRETYEAWRRCQEKLAAAPRGRRK